jgi:hypothetical protein
MLRLRFVAAHLLPVDPSRPSTPIIDTETSVISADKSSHVSTPPPFALPLDTTIREPSDTLFQIKALLQETKRLEKVLQNNFRATSEEYRRLEARLELLEQSSRHIAHACQNKSCRSRGYASVENGSPKRTEDFSDSKGESKRLFQDESSSSALMDKWEIPVQDSVMRSKVADRAFQNHNCVIE